MNWQILSIVVLTLAAVPAALFVLNLFVYRRLPEPDNTGAWTATPVSVLIPARNEEANIREAVESVLANTDAQLEVLVLDDHSTDGTAGIVEECARRDPRIRLVQGPPLPPGWCGKQHACHLLAREARHPLLLFMDADVRLERDAIRRMVRFIERDRAGLISGVPRQLTGSAAEKLMIPLIHFVLLGFLPMLFMRLSRHPAFGAGCGQLFLARAEAYREAGGHAAIRGSLHDGVKLPRAFRQAGWMTDLFDATDVARCRMFRQSREVWPGLSRNATEGLAAPGMILPATLLLLGGQVLPLVLLAAATVLAPGQIAVSAVAVALSLLPRLLGAIKFRQSPGFALLHPVSIFLFVAMQWSAFGRAFFRRPSVWRGRAYVAGSPGGKPLIRTRQVKT